MTIAFNGHLVGQRLTFGSGNENYLSGSFHSHAKRTQKTSNRVWQSQLDSLRWHLFAAPVFDSDWFQKAVAKDGAAGGSQIFTKRQFEDAVTPHLTRPRARFSFQRTRPHHSRGPTR